MEVCTRFASGLSWLFNHYREESSAEISINVTETFVAKVAWSSHVFTLFDLFCLVTRHRFFWFGLFALSIVNVYSTGDVHHPGLFMLQYLILDFQNNASKQPKQT